MTDIDYKEYTVQAKVAIKGEAFDEILNIILVNVE